ncbi:MAG TPA: TonB-dependent receptor, partial [Longimicrobiales bacterium]|nr:TonB-dependent receptor [Longimicrobiales bacterium]
MNRSPAWLLATILVLSAPGDATAQVPDSIPVDSSLIRLADIRVRAIAPIVTVGGTSALRVRLDSLGLPPASTMEDLLRRIPMLHVRTNSRGEAELTARGSESRQVAVLVDGIPLTLGWDGRADMSVLPATAPISVTLLRGLSSMLHGPNVLAGAVELSVAGEHIPDEGSAEASSAIDHTGGWGVSGQATIPVQRDDGAWLLRGGGGWRRSPGAPLARGVREPVPADRDLRLNTDDRSIDGFVAARYRADAGQWLSASAYGFSAERGIAAELDNTDPRFWRYPHVSRAVAALSGGTGFHETPFGTGDLEASIGFDVGRTEIDAYDSRTYDVKTAFEHGDDRTLTLRLLGDHTLGARGDLQAAFTFADIRHIEQLPGDTATYQQRLYSLGAETIWSLTDRLGPLRNLRVSFGGAFDAGSTPRTGGKPSLPTIHDWGGRAGMSMTTASGLTQFHAGISRRGRFPALREAFSGAIDRFQPNPGLTPEHLTAIEAGVTTALGDGHVQAVAFRHRLRDVIVRIALPDGRFQRVNENEMRSTGLELLAGQAFGPVSVGGDLLWQSVELIQPGQSQGFLENQPEIAWGVHSTIPLPLDADLYAEARHTGVQH